MTHIRSSPGFRLRVAVGRITMGCECVLVWGQVSDLPDFERFLATDLDENVAAILPAGETHLRTLCKITESIFLVLLAFSAFAQQPTQPTSAQESLRKWRESKWVTLRDDFGELGRYRDANAALKPPSPGENRVIFFGDSITDLWKLDEYFRDKPYINRGIGGRASNGLIYLDYFNAMVDEKGLLKRDLAEDGLHPNKAGYAIMAPLAQAAIGRALSSRP